MTRPAAAVLMIAAAAAGCRGRSDLVEAELRARDQELWHLRSELAHLEAVNQGLERGFRERVVVRPGLPPPAAVEIGPAVPVAPPGPLMTPPVPPSGPAPLPPPVAVPASTSADAPDFLIKDINIGRPTGGVDEDRSPGDEALRVTVVPRDVDGHAVKAPGTVVVAVAQISTDGLKLPLDAWEVGPTELRSTWKAALFGSGYQLTFALRVPPAYEKLRVVVRFTTPGGRTLEAEKDVTVRPCPAGPAALPVLPHPRPAESAPVLPPPTTSNLEPASAVRLLPPDDAR